MIADECLVKRGEKETSRASIVVNGRRLKSASKMLGVCLSGGQGTDLNANDHR
jgi:hypothetical protein